MPFKSPFADVEIPDVSVYDYLFSGLTDDDLGRTAVFDSATGSETTYGDLRARIDAFAGALAARGIKPGDVVALHCPNTAAFIIAFHGILRAGATATTINSLYTPARDRQPAARLRCGPLRHRLRCCCRARWPGAPRSVWAPSRSSCSTAPRATSR